MRCVDQLNPQPEADMSPCKLLQAMSRH